MVLFSQVVNLEDTLKETVKDSITTELQQLGPIDAMPEDGDSTTSPDAPNEGPSAPSGPGN